MSILDESYFPYTVDHREILLTNTLCLCSRSNSNNLGFYSWKFSLCRPASTYQIVSSEATKTETQHSTGTKSELPLCSVHASPCYQQLQVQLQSYQQSQQRAKKTVTTDRNEHVQEQISLMKWQVWGGQCKVRCARETHKHSRTSGLDTPAPDLNRWKAPLLSLRGQINIIKRDVMPAF